jgi:quinol monooxygenase YgiN
MGRGLTPRALSPISKEKRGTALSDVTVGLLVTLRAKAGREQELADFLESARPLVLAEPETEAWFASRIDETRFGIFDVFRGESGRAAHLNGPVAAALLERADELLAAAPSIEPVGVVAAKR